MSTGLWRLRALQRSEETGFTLVEVLIVMSIMTIMVGALTAAFFAGFRGNDKVNGAVPGPRNANALGFWLASDISSAVPVNATTWLAGSSASPDPGTGCSTTPAATTNLLRIETRNPITGTETYVASYRYAAPVSPATTGTISRYFCRTGLAPSSSDVLVENVEPAPPSPFLSPQGTVPAVGQDTATIAFTISARGTYYAVSQSAAVRVPATRPPIATIATTTITPKPPCAYTLSSASPSPIARNPQVGNAAKPLVSPLIVTVRDNSASGAACTLLVAKSGGIACVLAAAGATWTSNACFGPLSGGSYAPGVQVVAIFNREPGDPVAIPPVPPTDTQILGPTLTFTVT